MNDASIRSSGDRLRLVRAVRRPEMWRWLRPDASGRVLIVARTLVIQIGAIYIVLQAYSTLRKIVFQRPPAVAFAHALDVINLQRGLGLPVEKVELALQRRVLEHGWLIDLFNAYYRQMKPVLYVGAALAIVFAPSGFRAVRRVFLTVTLLALPWYALYPLAPPRFMGDRGYPFVDTLAVHGAIVSSSGGVGGANQYAAMPSMHIGWSIVAAYWLAVALPRWRLGAVLGVVHIILMSLSVMATGNHYWLDVAAGCVIFVVAAAIARLLRRRGEPPASGAQRDTG